MQNNNRGRLKGAFFLGLAFVLWMFGPKVPLDRYFAPSAVSESKSAPTIIQSSASREISAELTDITVPTPLPSSEKTLREISQCLPDLTRGNKFSVLEVVDLLKSSRTAQIAMDSQNLHIKTSDGRDLRLMIAPTQSAEFSGLEAQLFSVDRDGLPIFEKLPLHIDGHDIESSRKYFLDLGELVLSETSYRYEDKEQKITGKLTYNFDQLSGAELFHEGRLLGCSQSSPPNALTCDCLLN